MIPINFKEQDINLLGKRLDNAKYRLTVTDPGSWAHTHWSKVVEYLQNRWARMTKLGNCVSHRGGKGSIQPRYNWYMETEPVTGNSFERWMTEVFDKQFVQDGLQASIDRHIEEEIMLIKRGLR